MGLWNKLFGHRPEIVTNTRANIKPTVLKKVKPKGQFDDLLSKLYEID